MFSAAVQQIFRLASSGKHSAAAAEEAAKVIWIRSCSSVDDYCMFCITGIILNSKRSSFIHS